MESELAEINESQENTFPEEWDLKTIDESLGRKRFSVGKIKKSDYLPVGKYPIIDQGEEKIAGYWNKESDVFDNELPVIIFGDHTRRFKFVDQKFVRGADGTKILKPKKIFDTKFFFYAAKSLDVPNKGYNRHYKYLRELIIPVPPKSEQRKIASILTTIQDAIEQTEAVIQSTRELKKSMMKHLFTYGPVPVDQTDQVELEETDIGIVQKEWGVKKIGDVTNGTQYGINKSGNQEGEYPVLRMSNQSNGKIYLDDLQYVDLDDQEFEKYKLNKGDILFNRTNSFELVGKTSIFDHDRDDIVFASYLVRVFPDKDGINPYFLNYYMNKESTQRRLKTVATRAVSQSNINATKLRNFEVPVPNSETQDKIVSELKTIDSKIDQEKDKKIALESLFNSLLENLMTAKVRVV